MRDGVKSTIPSAVSALWFGPLLALAGLLSADSAAAAEPTPETATKDAPYVNKLGMKFVPVPGTNLLFSVWETRVQDYELFLKETNRPSPKPDFEQAPTHPAVMMNWHEARAFCEWLTGKDGKRYRLPTDVEWSAAAGLLKERGAAPEDRNFKARGYPWGPTWPPARGAGNYGAKLAVDDFAQTAPVGSFAANALGLHDLGGNVWEWCDHKYVETKEERVMRGGGWNVEGETGLRLSARSSELPDLRFGSLGFRAVLALPVKK